MVALERSLAPDSRQSAARRPRKSEPGSQHIGARLIASTDSRRPKKEGGAHDRAGSRRHEAAKGLSAARQHFCENGSRWVLLSTPRLWRRTKHDGVALIPHALSHELWSSDRSFVF